MKCEFCQNEHPAWVLCEERVGGDTSVIVPPAPKPEVKKKKRFKFWPRGRHEDDPIH